jgi:hypothetical protein
LLGAMGAVVPAAVPRGAAVGARKFFGVWPGDQAADSE